MSNCSLWSLQKNFVNRISQAHENLEKSLHEFLKIVESLTERLMQITNQLEARYIGKEIEKLTKTMIKIVQNNPELKRKFLASNESEKNLH